MKTFLKKIIFLLGIFASSVLPAQRVITIAGVLETAGHLDGEPYSALFNNPHGIANDSLGNLFIVDRFGNYIRKIAADGTVTTIAGTGESGSADGPGDQATFNEPWGICVGQNGDIFVADTRNNLIRKIDANGEVSTFAGSGNFGSGNGQGQSSTFGNPTGLVMDKQGNLYVADHLTHIIRKISPTGFVSTIAGKPYTPGAEDGTGSNARFYRPYGITLDLDENIIVADEWNHLIRKVSPQGEVSTVAGIGIVGSQDGQATQASFNYPWDVTVDKNGDIFVTDGYNNVIRKIETTGIVSTYVGTAGETGGTDGDGPAATFSGAVGLTYYSQLDEIFVADTYNNLIRKIINLNEESLGIQFVNPVDGRLCEGESLTVNAFPDIFDAYTFWIDGVEVGQSNDPGFTINDIPAGSHTIQVLGQNGGSVVSSISYPFTVLPAPVPTISVVGDLEFFQGDSVTLISSFGESYLWNNGSITALIRVFDSGIYSVEIEDEFGCIGESLPVEVNVIPPVEEPVITFLEGSALVCPNEKVILQSNYEDNNQWFLDGWAINGATQNTFEVEEDGIYQLQVNDTSGLILFSEEEEVTFLPKQIIDFTTNRTVAAVGDGAIVFTPEVLGVISFYWDFGDGSTSIEQSPTHNYLSAGKYSPMLITEDNNACHDTLVKTNLIEIRAQGNGGPTQPIVDSTDIYIPSAFTPDGDQINDVFFVRGEDVQGLNLSVFNQWGEVVFQSNNKEQGWEGNFRGKDAQASTYTYVAQITLYSGVIEKRVGHITLIR